MTPNNTDNNEIEMQPGQSAPTPVSEPDTTRRISREPEEVSEPEEKPRKKKGLIGMFQAAFRDAKDGRETGATRQPDRGTRNVDRSKGLVVIVICGVVVGIFLIGVFSRSNNGPKTTAKRTTPNLGRPADSGNPQEKRGSVTPLHNADLSGGQNQTDDQQVDADDIKHTARQHFQPHQEPTPVAQTLASIPPADPALEAYRRSREGNTAVPPPPPPPAAPAPPPSAPAPVRNESDGLKKASLVFVRNEAGSAPGLVRPTAASTRPAFLDQGNSPLLPTGSRLVARFQTAVSTAVKTPVVAAIEYNYERDGEIVIPAGTKAFGDLQQANRSGVVNVRFHTLQMPDGTSEAINGSAISLSYGPLQGSVSGGNRAKRILVRSFTGIGTVAAFLVGGPGGVSGASGALDNSILLRERIASNAGLAGEQEFASLAANENIVITVPANTRFFIVLQDGNGDSKTAPRTVPTRAPAGSQFLNAGASSPLPTAQELRELIELKNELNRVNAQATVATTSVPTSLQ